MPNPTPGINNPGGTLEQSRPYFLSGKVVVDGAGSPPESVTIEYVCGSIIKPVAYTDSKGHFSFQLGQNSDVIPDASIDDTSAMQGGRFGGNPAANPRFRMEGCELQAVLPGYSSDAVQLSSHRYMDDPDVGSIVLHRLGNMPGSSISATSYEAPSDAQKAFNKGLDAARKQKWHDAQARFAKAAEIYPKYAAAWFELGTALQHQGLKPEARDAFEKSIQADPKYLGPYLPLMVLASEENNWQKTADLSGTLTRLNPSDPFPFLLNSIAAGRLGKLDDAEKSAREAVRLDTKHRVPRADYVLGLILAQKRDYDAALPLLKSYIQLAPNAPDGDTVRKQISQIEDLAKSQPAPAQH